jgi:hypothetical protein
MLNRTGIPIDISGVETSWRQKLGNLYLSGFHHQTQPVEGCYIVVTPDLVLDEKKEDSGIVWHPILT